MPDRVPVLRLCRLGSAEQISLGCLNAETAKDDHLPWLLDALCDDGDAKGSRQNNKGLDRNLTDFVLSAMTSP